MFLFLTDSISSTQVESKSSFQQSAIKTTESSQFEVLSKKFSFVTSLIQEEVAGNTTISSS